MHVFLNVPPVSSLYSQRTHFQGPIFISFVFCFLENEDSGDKGWKRKSNEARDVWGSGSPDPGKHSPEHFTKRSPGQPGEGTQNPVPGSPVGTLAELEHQELL